MPRPHATPPPHPAEQHVLVSNSSDSLQKHKDITGLLHRCCERGGCLLDDNFSTERTPPVFPRRSRPLTRAEGTGSEEEEDEGRKYQFAPLIFSSASAAQWRRRGASVGNSQREREKQQQKRGISPQDLVLKVAVMEEVHGVDVSWLHKPTKEKSSNDKDKSQQQHQQGGHRRHISNAPVFNANKETKQPKSSTNDVSQQQKRQPQQSDKVGADLSKLPSPANVTPPTPVQPSKDTTQAVPSTPTPSTNGKAQPKRPNILGRQVSNDDKAGSRRQSWMNSLSSKFSSSQATPTRATPAATPPAGKQLNGNVTQTASVTSPEEAVEEVEAYTPPKQKESSFFSSLTRRLSSASQTGGNQRVQGTGGVCPRKILNVDPNRERCLVPEMDPNRLRKVSFCVDVEIAGGPRYYDDDEDDETRNRRKKEFKMKERAEGEALKRPEALEKEKDDEGEPKLESKSKAIPIPSNGSDERGSDENLAPAKNSLDDEATARKREKKKKSEEERKERKEKRRRRAEENGSIPVELSLDNGEEDAKAGSSPSGTPSPPHGASAPQQAPPQATPTPTRQDRPTIDPARIYRRCCQLRETPILKRITEQLMNPKANLPTEPGIVSCLDLTGSRLQLADVITLGDWLAVVPVKHLKLEDADLNDEGVRCILAGLLAAKRPEPTKRKTGPPKHREGLSNSPHKERAGVVERVTFKNNPRISRLGWKHISLFLYLCRSLKAIDVSLNQFPDTLPPSAQSTPVKSPSQNGAHVGTRSGEDVDAAEVLYKCLSERLAGSKLEEFIVSECGLNAAQVRKIVDGCIIAGVSRLGLAGNSLDDDGLEHIIHYLRSNVCRALDLGGNDLRGKLGIVAEALRSKATALPCWGLSLAACNLDSQSLKPLFSTLVQLPDFRFIDLSHNRDLCSHDNGLISLLRRYVSQMKNLKRIHLSDVGMSSKQAIALADVLPEGPRLAHLNLMENPKLQALADAKTEEEQEEACALYASLMAAARVSSTLICIDIDVPSAESSELVKALAKQVVAYSLRNMENFAIAEATGALSTTNAQAVLTGPHGGEKGVKDISVPDVLWHLVGHVEGSSENHDHDAPAPDEDYIVGGTGVVKALQYVLGEKAADDVRRGSLPQTPTKSGSMTPVHRPDSSAGLPATEEQKGKAKKMSLNLLDSARKIRQRLQPSLMKEASQGDEMAYRRLLFLDQTLQSMIERFEEEYPECRIAKPFRSEKEESSSLGPTDNKANRLAPSSSSAQGGTEATSNVSDDEDFMDAEDGPSRIRPTTMSRHNSDVSVANRKQQQEEGHIHRLGIQLRREIIATDGDGSGLTSSRPGTPTTGPGATQSQSQPQPPATQQQQPVASSSGSGAATAPNFPARMSSVDKEGQTDEDAARLHALGAHIESISGVDLRQVLHDNQGWENALKAIGANYEDLRRLQERDPEGWEGFKVAQRLARENMERERPGSSAGLPAKGS